MHPKNIPLALALVMLVTACKDESIAGYAPQGTTWRLSELAGQPVSTPITLTLASTQITGRAPCNSYSAKQTAPAPWFALGPIAATKMACPNLALEQTYFATLATITNAEVTAQTLILSDDTNVPVLVFHPQP